MVGTRALKRRRRLNDLPSRPQVRIEDVMTPRSLLVTVKANEKQRARDIAKRFEFDAIPIVGSADIKTYWSRVDNGVRKVGASKLVRHDAALVDTLDRLVKHGVQFVEYQSLIVGLIDVADLNRPEARLVFLHPLLALEQAIALASRARGIEDEHVARLLGKAAKAARKRQLDASRVDLRLPLLEFALFTDVLRVARALEIITKGSEEDFQRLSRVRNSVAHGSRRPIEGREDGAELLWARDAARRLHSTIAVSPAMP